MSNGESDQPDDTGDFGLPPGWVPLTDEDFEPGGVAYDDEPVEWTMDRPGSVNISSNRQLRAMENLADPFASTRCDGTVAVHLDGTWICSASCSGPPTYCHGRAHVHDCHAGVAENHSPCCCWVCLNRRAR